MSHLRAMVAEFIGTFALTFVGAGSIIIVMSRPELGGGLLAIALAHGLILSVMVSATMHISGGQFNPAVSFALAVVGAQPWPRALIFAVAQIVASVAAAAILKATLSDIEGITVGNVGATLGKLSTSDHTMLVMVMEIIATFMLMFTIMGTAVDPRGVGRSMSVGGFGIGLTVAANILFFGPISGASMNPARSFGPALVAGAWDIHWVYWVAPVIGATLAAVVYKASFGTAAKPEPS